MWRRSARAQLQKCLLCQAEKLGLGLEGSHRSHRRVPAGEWGWQRDMGAGVVLLLHSKGHTKESRRGRVLGDQRFPDFHVPVGHRGSC